MQAPIKTNAQLVPTLPECYFRALRHDHFNWAETGFAWIITLFSGIVFMPLAFGIGLLACGRFKKEVPDTEQAQTTHAVASAALPASTMPLRAPTPSNQQPLSQPAAITQSVKPQAPKTDFYLVTCMSEYMPYYLHHALKDVPHKVVEPKIHHKGLDIDQSELDQLRGTGNLHIIIAIPVAERYGAHPVDFEDFIDAAIIAQLKRAKPTSLTIVGNTKNPGFPPIDGATGANATSIKEKLSQELGIPITIKGAGEGEVFIPNKK